MLLVCSAVDFICLVEQAVLKEIDKGDIVSSGAPQISKDGRTSTDVTQSRRTKPGSSYYQYVLTFNILTDTLTFMD